jgi:hypothetical protein
MPRYGKESNQKPEDIIEKARTFFGPGGVGLEITDEGQCCITFEGGGGHVRIDAASKGKGSDVDIETREWDYQVKEFLRKI